MPCSRVPEKERCPQCSRRKLNQMSSTVSIYGNCTVSSVLSASESAEPVFDTSCVLPDLVEEIWTGMSPLHIKRGRSASGGAFSTDSRSNLGGHRICDRIHGSGAPDPRLHSNRGRVARGTGPSINAEPMVSATFPVSIGFSISVPTNPMGLFRPSVWGFA